MDLKGEEFLNKLYNDLYKSNYVMHNVDSKNMYNKKENIKVYMDRLEKLHNSVENSKSYSKNMKHLKQLYYEKYVIKFDDISNRYYNHQEEIALETGYGHIQFREEEINKMAKIIINNQKKSLDTWIEYFTSKDSNMYPIWAKYWAFQGMLQLGNYNKITMEFNKRNKNTISLFPELNREALAISIDNMIKYLNDKTEIDDEELSKILKNGSFGKIYAYTLSKILRKTEDIKETNNGKWVKYKQGSDDKTLVKSLQGHCTGWCIVGECTAKKQLSYGDIYVYYSYDQDNNPTIPRIEIRMEDNQIAEIRGVGKNQNIEPGLEEILDIKLKEFPDKDKYNKKVNDMRTLTEIYNKYQSDEDISLDELRFLYQIDNKIDNFGDNDEPRIDEIIYERNIRKDLSNIFHCKENQIGINEEDIIDNDILYYYGDLSLKSLDEINLPQNISGDLDLSEITNLEGISFPQNIGGTLDLSSLKEAKNIKFPQIIKGDLNLNQLVCVKDITLPDEIGGSLDLGMLEESNGIKLPQSIGVSLDLSSLINAEGLIFPQSMDASIFLGKLKTAKGLELPQKIKGALDLSGLKSAEDLKLPQTIGTLYLDSLTSAKGLNLPNNINGTLYLTSLKSMDGLKLPQTIEGSLDLRNLQSAKELTFPQNIKGCLSLASIKSAEGVVFPQSVGEGLPQNSVALILSSLQNAEDLNLPQNINGSLQLDGLTSVNNLILPQNIEGTINLYNLRTAKVLVFPQNFRYNIFLNNLEIIEDLILPQNMNGSLYLNKLKSIEGLILPKKIDSGLDLSNLTNVEGIILPQKVKETIYLTSATSLENVTLPENFTEIQLADAVSVTRSNAKNILVKTR